MSNDTERVSARSGGLRHAGKEAPVAIHCSADSARLSRDRGNNTCSRNETQDRPLFVVATRHDRFGCKRKEQ